MMRTENRVVLITGARNWDDDDASLLVNWLLETLWTHGFRVLVHGAAKGIDRMADHHGHLLPNPYDVRPYPADWDKYKKAAGPIRNRQMHDAERPDLVVGIHRELWLSRGTLDMMRYASEQGTPVYHLHSLGQLTSSPDFQRWLKAKLDPGLEPAARDETNFCAGD
jgi:hypothetical protein